LTKKHILLVMEIILISFKLKTFLRA